MSEDQLSAEWMEPDDADWQRHCRARRPAPVDPRHLRLDAECDCGRAILNRHYNGVWFCEACKGRIDLDEPHEMTPRVGLMGAHHDDHGGPEDDWD